MPPERTYTLALQPHDGSDLVRVQFQERDDAMAAMYARGLAEQRDASIIRLTTRFQNFESNVEWRG